MSTLVLEIDRHVDPVVRHSCKLKQIGDRPPSVNGAQSLPFVQHHRPSLPPKRNSPESYSIYVIGQNVRADSRSKSCSNLSDGGEGVLSDRDVTGPNVTLPAAKISPTSSRRRIIRKNLPSARSCHTFGAKVCRSRDRFPRPGCYSAMLASCCSPNPLHVTSDSVVLTSRPKSMVLGPRSRPQLTRCQTADVISPSHQLTDKITGLSESHNVTRNNFWTSDNGQTAYIRTTMSLTKPDGRAPSCRTRNSRTIENGFPDTPVWPEPLCNPRMLSIQQALHEKDMQVSLKDLLRTRTCRSPIRVDHDRGTASNFGQYSYRVLGQAENNHNQLFDSSCPSDSNVIDSGISSDLEPASRGDVNGHVTLVDAGGSQNKVAATSVDLKPISLALIPRECYENYKNTRGHKIRDTLSSHLNGDELGQTSFHPEADEYLMTTGSQEASQSELDVKRALHQKHGTNDGQSKPRETIHNDGSSERITVGNMKSEFWGGEAPDVELTVHEVMASRVKVSEDEVSEIKVSEDEVSEIKVSEAEVSDDRSTSEDSTTSGTSTATFPGSDLLYGGADGGLPKMAHVDYLARTDVSNYEKERQRLRDLEIVNKRPSSKGGKRGSHPFVDNELTSDRERDDVRVLTGHTTVKLQPYKGPALTSSLVRGEPILAQRPNGSNSVRESEDLIAMGTLFTPTNYVTCNGVTRGSASSTTTASTKSNQYGGPQNSPQSGPPVTNNTPGRKTITFSMNSTKQTSNVNGMMTSQRQFGQNFNIKEDPKYPDPLVGATASYQQRLMELAALETETIRWERTKKVKKKT